MVNKEYVEHIRHFNRFYNRIIGINDRYTDKSKFSLTEVQILYEIAKKSNCTAVYLTDFFNLDKGYLSRILKHFEKEELLRKIPSDEDKRMFFLELTDKGNEELDSMIEISNKIVFSILDTIDADKQEELIQSMKKIEGILRKYTIT